jgi:hypothetical protein
VGATSPLRHRILQGSRTYSLELLGENVQIRVVLGSPIRRTWGVVGGIAERVDVALLTATSPLSPVAARTVKKRKFSACGFFQLWCTRGGAVPGALPT